MSAPPKACPYVARECLQEGCMAWRQNEDCSKCGPDLWNYAQQIRAGFLNELIQSELAEAGIKADDQSRWRNG